MAILLTLVLIAGLYQEGPETFNQAGLERFHTFDFVGASREFQKAQDLDPDNDIIMMNLLLSQFYAGSLDQTDAELHSLLDIEELDPHANFLAGLIASREGQFEEAARHFEEVRKVDPTDAGTLHQLGLIEFHEGRYQAAVDLFRQSIDLDNSNSASFYNLARALIMHGEHQEGETQMERFRAMRKKQPMPRGGGMGDPSITPGKYGQPRSLAKDSNR
ncbi:MAG: tetratricopeptide repeat protein [Acidobacteriota bacterium]|nr:MAG: tetratricopeptide repeat protein [Acidobacteriota bacterium]